MIILICYTCTQVNLKSCCVVPEELSAFAKSAKITLLTHSDPGELLPGDSLRNMLYPKLAREAGHYAADWVARYKKKFPTIFPKKRLRFDLDTKIQVFNNTFSLLFHYS